MNDLRRAPLNQYTPPTVKLTVRQRAVVELLISGHTVAEIAAALRCTEATVRAHIQAIAAELPGPHPPMRRILVHGAKLVANDT